MQKESVLAIPVAREAPGGHTICHVIVDVCVFKRTRLRWLADRRFCERLLLARTLAIGGHNVEIDSRGACRVQARLKLSDDAMAKLAWGVSAGLINTPFIEISDATQPVVPVVWFFFFGFFFFFWFFFLKYYYYCPICFGC